MVKEKSKFQGQYGFVLKPEHKESVFSKSRTQPNAVLSVEEIVRRSANGIPLGNMAMGSYEDEDLDLPDDYYEMDNLEKIQYARDRAESLSQMKSDYEESRKEEARKAAAAKSDAIPPKGPKAEASEDPNSGD